VAPGRGPHLPDHRDLQFHDRARERAAYGLPAKTIAAALRGLLELENIAAADTALAGRAMNAYESGLDFADALHALQGAEGDDFITFDRALVRGAAKAGLRGVALLKP
jgi:predicted nucleic acid-binding protein